MTRELSFEKLNGAGNDFIFIEDLDDAIEFTPSEVQYLCDRHFGIGADGIIIVKPAQDPANSGFMDYINADGTRAQMCGNGIRCFAKYLVDHNLAGNDSPYVRVETRAGVKEISYSRGSDGLLETATVNMGVPILDPVKVPTSLDATAHTDFGEAYVKDAPLDSPYGSFSFTCISMGNPHAITFVDDVDGIDVDKIGKYYENCQAFPEKANIEFATVGDGGIKMRVFERGCGETLACGTGACATAVAAYLTGRAGLHNDLHLRGGTLHISYVPGGPVTMSGPAAIAYKGNVAL